MVKRSVHLTVATVHTFVKQTVIIVIIFAVRNNHKSRNENSNIHSAAPTIGVGG